MLIRWELVCYFFANFAYAIVYTAGLPLLTRQKFGDNFAAYGLLISIYGGASVIANIVMGNKKIRNPGLTIFIAYTLWGIGFMLPPLAPNIVLAAFGLAWQLFQDQLFLLPLLL